MYRNLLQELNIIMELGDGNLQEHLSKGPMTFGDILDFVQQMVDVMEYLYKKKIIHRDIKPANILLKDGLYKLCDFGLVSLQVTIIDSIVWTQFSIGKGLVFYCKGNGCNFNENIGWIHTIHGSTN